MKTQASSSQARTHLLKMRRLMRAEASVLAKEFAKRQIALTRQLQRLEKRLQKDSDNVLLAELGAIRDELSAVRRGLARLAMAEQPTLKLKNEWHDWARHAELSEGIDHALREERLEMLASELRLRGVHVPERRVAEQAPPASVKGMSKVEEVVLASFEPASMAEATEEEPEERADWSVASEYWEQLISSCDPRHIDTLQLARLLKTFRHVQGEKKKQDRQSGVRRDRLIAFETWS